MNETVKYLLEYKAKHDLKNHELAKLLDTTEGTISRWLNGKSSPSFAWRELIKIRLVKE